QLASPGSPLRWPGPGPGRSRGPFRRRDRRPPAPSRVPLPSPGTSSPRTRGCSDASRPTVPRPWSCRCRGALRSPGSSGFPSCGVGRPGPERNSHLLEAASESDVLQYAGDDLAERNRKEGIQEDPRGQDVDRIQVHVIGPRHRDPLVPEVIETTSTKSRNHVKITMNRNRVHAIDLIGVVCISIVSFMNPCWASFSLANLVVWPFRMASICSFRHAPMTFWVRAIVTQFVLSSRI